MLLYSVHDCPRVAHIGFEGAKLLGDAALDAKLPIAKESPYDAASASKIALAVRDEYRLRGYEAARVVVVAEPAPGSPDRVDVRLKVDEGAQSRFAKVEFKGNKKVPEAELRKAIALEAGKPFVREEVERATLLLSALLLRARLRTGPRRRRDRRGERAGRRAARVRDRRGRRLFDRRDPRDQAGCARREGAPRHGRARSPEAGLRPLEVVEDLERVNAFFAARKQQVVVTPLTELDPKKKHRSTSTLAQVRSAVAEANRAVQVASRV